jgi:hypothetical protein
MVRRYTAMYAGNAEQAVKMRELAAQMRGCVRETRDSYYRRLFHGAALDLETAADRMDIQGWRPPLH